MPMFFFHVYDDLDTFDEEGRELPSITAARDHALIAARSLAAEQAKGGRINLGDCIVVTDAEGCTVITLPFAEAVEVDGR